MAASLVFTPKTRMAASVRLANDPGRIDHGHRQRARIDHRACAVGGGARGRDCFGELEAAGDVAPRRRRHNEDRSG